MDGATRLRIKNLLDRIARRTPVQLDRPASDFLAEARRERESRLASRVGGGHDLAAWHRSMTPRERLYLAFRLSRTGAELARRGARARSRGN